MPTKLEWSLAILLPLQITFLSSYLLSSPKSPDSSSSTNENGSDDIRQINISTSAYFIQFLLYIFLDATYSNFFHLLLLIPSRWIASHLPGAVVPKNKNDNSRQWLEQEEESNDSSLVWPSKQALDNLPKEWGVAQRENGAKKDEFETYTVVDESKKKNSPAAKRRQRKKSITGKPPLFDKSDANNSSQGKKSNGDDSNGKKKNKSKQPYYINHVRGSTRIRQASQRVAAALGTLGATYVICSFPSSLVSMNDIGLKIDSPDEIMFDLINGFAIGSFIVTFIIMMEFIFDWIAIVGCFEVVAPREVFAVNFLWDVLFHVGVSINEEVMLRGWMFILVAKGILISALGWFEDMSNAVVFAVVMAIVLQSTLFALMHLYSPGSTSIVSMMNLFLGGIAASLNVMVTGGSLWLGIGWHFGWNIMMGHVWGRSTSGIPLSCSMVSVVPRPAETGDKEIKRSHEHFHGGSFGPEQGVLAPLAYVMGIWMVIRFYGWEELVAWIEELVESTPHELSISKV